MRKNALRIRWMVGALLVTISVMLYIAFLTVMENLPNLLYKDTQKPRELPVCPLNSTTDEVTVLTAYFNIGTFGRDGNQIRKPQNYYKWMGYYKYVDNPFIAYTNDKQYYENVKRLRSVFSPNRTRIVWIDPWKLRSFSRANHMKLIYNQTGYRQFLPSSVIVNYTCVTHSKLELLQLAIKEQYFHTKYIAWVDVGLHRILKTSATFHYTPPPKFDESKVAFQQAFKFKNLPLSEIIKPRLTWVGGGTFMGRIDRVLTFTEDFSRAVKELLRHNMTSAEEAVIYAMYSPTFYFRPRIQIQAFNDPGWYGLANKTRVWGPYKGRKTEANDKKCALIVNRLINNTFPFA